MSSVCTDGTRSSSVKSASSSEIGDVLVGNTEGFARVHRHLSL